MARVRKAVLAIAGAVVLLSSIGVGSPASARDGDSGKEDVGGPANSINPQPASNIKSGGTFRFPQITLCPQFNGNTAGGNAADCSSVMNTLLPSYIYFNGNGQLSIDRDFAVSIKASRVQGKQTVTYALNPNARWSNGRAVDASDFIGMWKALNRSNPAYAIISSAGYDQIESVVQGKTRFDVIVTFKTTYPDWQPLFSALKPVELTATPEAFNTSWRNGPTVTAGPFVWVGIDNTAKTVTVRRNPKWWGDKPYLDQIVYRQIPQPAQIDALLNGEIDFMDVSIDPNAVARIKADKGKKVRVQSRLAPNWEHFTFGPVASNAVTGDVAVRQALALSLDRQQIAEAIQGPIIGKKNAKALNNRIFFEGGRYACTSNNAGKFEKRDLKAAAALLDKAGWTLGADGIRSKNGRKLSIALKYPSPNDARRDTVLLATAMAKEAGIELVPTLVPSAEYFVRHVTQPANFELAIFGWIGSNFPLSGSGNIYKLGTAQNFPNIGSAKQDSDIAAANSTLNAQKQCSFMNAVDKSAWDLMPSIPLFQRPNAVGVNTKLANYGAFGFTSLDWTKVGFTK